MMTTVAWKSCVHSAVNSRPSPLPVQSPHILSFTHLPCQLVEEMRHATTPRTLIPRSRINRQCDGIDVSRRRLRHHSYSIRQRCHLGLYRLWQCDLWSIH
jgi:hypothetical protein